MKTVFCFISFFLSIIVIGQNVGIGISNPTRAKLEINGAVDATSAIFGGEGTGISLQRNWPAVGFNQYYNSGDKYIGTGYAAAIALDPNAGFMVFDMFPAGIANNSIPSSTRAMFFSSSGNVGIGTSAPIKAGLVVDRTVGGYLHAIFGSNTKGVAIESNWPGIGFNAYYNDGRRFMSTGNAAHINLDPNTGAMFLLLDSTGTANSPVIQSNGLLLNTTSPTNMHIALSPYIDDRGVLGCFGCNEMRVWTAVFSRYFGTISDAREKKNIVPLQYGLKEVLQLKPVSYQWKNHVDGQVHLGLLAQEVKKIIPEIILEQGERLGMRPMDIIPVLIKSIQEQQSKIDELEKRMELMERGNSRR